MSTGQTTTTTTTTPAPTPLGVTERTVSCAQVTCRTDCEWLFGQLRVFPTIAGGTVVSWLLHPDFVITGPVTYQLQLGQTGNQLADDWRYIGSPVVDTYQLVDDAKRIFGKTAWTHYRVVATLPDGNSYASSPISITGDFEKRDWLLAREIMRAESLRLRKEAGVPGYLLKRRVSGTACPDCLDTLTEEVRDPHCATCYGTGFVGGYYAPVPCFYVELSPKATRTHLDESRGTVNDLPVISGRMLNVPPVDSYDVWVSERNDMRWIVHTIKTAVEIRGVPLVLYPVELRLAPYSNAIYTFPVV